MSAKPDETAGNSVVSGAKPATPSLFDLNRPSKGLVKEEGYSLVGLTVSELLERRGAIDALLPPRRLSEVDIEEELLLQFARTKELLGAVTASTDTPANQKAQVANACSAILEQLIKLQTRLYSAERVKILEAALIKTLREFDESVHARFLEIYERALTGLDAKG